MTGKHTAPGMARGEHRHHHHGGAAERWAHLDEPDRDAWQRPNVDARRLQHDDPGLEPGSIDRVLIVDLWHHLHHRVAYVRQLRAALRPEGRLLVIDRDAGSSHAPPIEMRINVETVLGELEAAGFSTRVLPQALPRQFMVEGTVRSATPPE